MQIYFDENNSPDLLDIPLKGEYLKEVGTLLLEQCDIMRNMFASLPPTEFSTGGGVLVLMRELANYFHNPKAQQHGITLLEVDALLKKHMADPSASVEETLTQLRSVSASDSVEEAKISLNDALENSVALAIKSVFSACLAAQENKKADYNALIDKYFNSVQIQIGPEIIELKEGADLQKNGMVVSLCGLTDFMETTLRTQQARRSLLTDLTKYQVEASKRFQNNVIAMVFDLDPDTHAGQEAIRQKLAAARQPLGDIKRSPDS